MSLLASVLPWVIGAFVVAMLLAGWRLLQGPSMPDRILALDTLYMNSLALLILLGMHWRTQVYFEAALIIAMMGFISTVALSRFLARGSISK
ncbi:MAG: K+/H+ antiporter subunit F [Burkholderiaceae bacterium]